MIEYTQTELRIMALVGFIGTCFAYMVGGIDNLVSTFLVLIAVDYSTGMFAAWKTGTVSSNKGFNGVWRKAIMLAIVVVARWIDVALGNGQGLRTMVLFAYIGNEGLSIVENIKANDPTLPRAATEKTDRTVVTPNSEKQKVDVYKINTYRNWEWSVA